MVSIHARLETYRVGMLLVVQYWVSSLGTVCLSCLMSRKYRSSCDFCSKISTDDDRIVTTFKFNIERSVWRYVLKNGSIILRP